MEKEITNYLPASEVEAPGKLERRVWYKPILGMFLLFGLGAAGIATMNVVGIIVGAVLVLCGLLTLFTVKDVKVMDVRTDGVVVYGKRDDTVAVYLPYKEIARWTVRRNTTGGQAVMLIKPDDQYVYTETFRLASIRRMLRKFMPTKEIERAQ